MVNTLNGSYADRYGRAIQMEKRMNELIPGNNLSRIANLQQFDFFEVDRADREMLSDCLLLSKLIAAMDARPRQDLKSTGKSVFMNGCRAIKPVICINIKVGRNV